MHAAHPVFKVLLAHPELLAEHAVGYGELLRAELQAASACRQRRLRLHLLAAGALLAGVVLGGQSVMWGSVVSSTPWTLLLAVPGLPLLVGLWACWMLAEPTPAVDDVWSGLSRQVSADLALLRDTAPRS